MEENLQPPLVDQATQNPTLETVVVSSKPKSFLPYLLTLLVISLSAAALYFYNQNIALKSQLASDSSPSPKSTTSDSVDLFADWQIYSNDRYGYSFKFPKNWKITFEDTYQYSNVTISTELDKSINVSHFTGKPSADEPNWTKNFVINDNSYIMSAFSHCAGGSGMDCGGAIEEKDIATFNQILSTFKVYPETANILIFDIIKKLTVPMIWSEEKPGELEDASGENVKGALITAKVATKEENKFAGLLVTDSPLVKQYGWAEDPRGMADGMGESISTYTKNNQKLIIRYKGGEYKVLLSK